MYFHLRKHLFLFCFIVVLDQVTKLVAFNLLGHGQSVPVIPNLFNFTLVLNPGAAFGMFGTLPPVTRRVVLGVVSLIALFVVIRFLNNEAKDDETSQKALIGILAGALGNIIDRIRLDAVIDFLDFYIGRYHWPAFNVADSAISVGVCILALRLFFKKT